MKISWKAGTMVYPLPAVLVSCGTMDGEKDVMTAAWTGTICSEPPMCYVSIRKSRKCHELISKTGEFVLNLTNVKMSRVTDWCGVKSGRTVNKWVETGLTPGKSEKIGAPTVEQAPISIECKVVEVKELGSHDMFIAEVVNVQVDDKYINEKSGALDERKMDLMAYNHGFYYTIGKRIGKYGWSVEKKKDEKEEKNVKKGVKRVAKNAKKRIKQATENNQENQ